MYLQSLEIAAQHQLSAPNLGERVGEWTRELLPRPGQFIGIEFDRQVVKFLVVRRRRKREWVHSLKVKMLATPDWEAFQIALTECVQHAGIKRGAHAVIALPLNLVHTRYVKLPAGPPRELRQMIRYHLPREMPLSPEEVVYDFRVLETDEEGHARVLVFLARKDDVQTYIELCRAAGLVVDAVRVSAEAVYRSFMRLFEAEPDIRSKYLIVVDVDFSSVKVLFIDRGELAICRHVPMGVANFADSLIDGSRQDAYELWSRGLAQSILQTVTLVRRELGEREVQQVFLSGWLPRAETLMTNLRELLEVPVTRFNPQLPRDETGEEVLENVSHRWFSLTALWEITREELETPYLDLRPPEAQKACRRRRLMRDAVYTGLLSLYLIGLLLVSIGVGLHRRDVALAALQERLAALKPRMEAVHRQQKMIRILDEELGSSEMTAAVLAQVFQKLPPGVQLQSLSYTRGQKLLLRGVAGNLAEVLNLPSQMMSQPALKEAVITSANRQRNSGGQGEVVQFEMTIRLSGG